MLPALVITHTHTHAHVEIHAEHISLQAGAADPQEYKRHASETHSQSPKPHTHTQRSDTHQTHTESTQRHKKSLRDTGTYINYIQLPSHKELFTNTHTHPHIDIHSSTQRPTET